MHRLLIANRGEIARRIVRTCRRLGIETVAVYSDADAGSPHVRDADQAVRLGAADPAESYLNIERVIAAAVDSGADAIHPGYGFLSEQPEFVEACTAAGLTFVGPGPDAMRSLGSKQAAKEVAAKADVPTVPTWPHDDVPADAYPVMVKASAGGGGRGMRIVDEPAQLAGALDAAAREAEAGFGDGTLLIEKYLPAARHVEVQLLADSHGNVAAIGDRDCSLQRRHQKVVEEAPAPRIEGHMRQALYDWTSDLASDVGYVGAGTAEFLVTPDGDAAYFLELNARLQVEHPVTEEAYGVDLVEWQLRIARGEKLELPADYDVPSAHSIEARVYAEDAMTMLPSGGTVLKVAWPDLAGVRIEHAIEPGMEIGTAYDPMLAKVIATAPSRDQARRLLAHALREVAIVGIEGNQAQLQYLVELPDFADARHTTATIVDHPIPESEARLNPENVQRAVGLWHRGSHGGTSPFQEMGRWRVDCDGGGPDRDTSARNIVMARRGDTLHITVNGIPGSIAIGGAAQASATVDDHGDASTARLEAPMPGTIVTARSEGDEVATGDAVIVLEAMKMENAIAAPFDGVIEHIGCTVGDSVAKGTELARVTRV